MTTAIAVPRQRAVRATPGLVAASPVCFPDRVSLTPVQTMITSRSGRVCLTVCSETVPRTVRPFLDVPAPGLGLIAPSAQDL